MTKKAFVTGATGYTGREVVRILSEQGLDTVAHIRPESSSREEWTPRFMEMGAQVDFTPWEVEAMSATLTQIKPDIVFFLVGTTKARDRESDEDAGYEAVDFGLLELLVEACENSESDPRFVYLSAMGVKEGARSSYYQARWKAEEAVRESGLPFIIARPGMITGPGRDESRPLERAGGAVADLAAGALNLVGAKKLADRYAPTDNTELATALVDLAISDEVDQVVEAEDLKRSNQ